MTLSVPDGWALAVLSDVAQWSSGGTPSRANPSFFSGSIPWIKTGELGPQFLHSAEEHISEEAVAASSAKVFPRGAVVLAMYGATIGKASILGVDASTNQACAVGIADAVGSLFLYYFLLSQRDAFVDAGKGGAQPNISRGIVKEWPIRVPPFNEQLRIVDRLEELLSDLDAGVAELKAAQRKLAQYRQSLLKAAVEGALTADWRAARRTALKSPNPSSPRKRGSSDLGSKALGSRLRGNDEQSTDTSLHETGADLLQRILTERRACWEAKQLAKFAEQSKTPPSGWQTKYSEPIAPDTNNLPVLPDGWSWATVDQLSFVVRGASPRPAGDPRYFGGSIPWITVGSLTADGGMYLDQIDQFVTEAGKDASRYIEPDTLLLTNSGATLGVPKITRIGGCINDGSVALLDVDEPARTYLYWFLRTQTKKLRAMNQGAAQPNLNTDIVRRITVPVCDYLEMAEINAVLDQQTSNLRNQEEAIARSLKQAAAQRKNLLKAAFAGQLVPQDPSDEPASVLLERIRAERAADGATTSRKRGLKIKETA